MGKDKKLAIGLPMGFPMVHADFFASYVMIDKGHHMLLRAEYGPITALRNQLVVMAIEHGADQLMMLDVDMVFPVNTVKQLQKTMDDSGVPIVAGLMYRRCPPFDPLVRVNGEEPEINFGEIMTVDRVGTACMLIDINWLKDNLEDPWFETENDTLGRPVIGEDFMFCGEVRKYGGEILVDTSVIPKHLTTLQVDETFGQMWAAIKKEQGNG